MVAGERTVAALERFETLPADSPTFREPLVRNMSGEARRGWHQRALAAFADAKVVFTDSDNEISSHVPAA